MNDNQTTENKIEKFKIRICFVRICDKKEYFKKIKIHFNRHYEIERNHLVQGEPFTWGLKIKNLDNKPTPIGAINDYGIRNLENNYFSNSETNDIRALKPLNPDEETIIKLGDDVSYVEGALWAFANIKTQDDKHAFEVYQFNPYHKADALLTVASNSTYNWIESIYIQKKMELLQAKTNNYILGLTIVSVWESLFGIKETVVNVLSYTSKLLNILGVATQYIANLI
ncbi:hypothetical protein ACP6EV_14905 [Aeromonas hydrophila]|uniref:hypothetical protein n=1 Tax=Aeromonas hydrophila TaxID=644 RepID=UPI003CF5DDEB